MKRKAFLQIALPTAWLLLNGRVSKASNAWMDEYANRKPLLRFVVTSDGHYGQKDTKYDENFAAITSRINEMHAAKAFAFVVVNGDIIHDDPTHFAAAKAALDKLQPTYYVSQGNHDHIDAAGWQRIWNMPVNTEVQVGKTTLLIGTTSNEKGEYLSPNMDWLKTQLEAHKKQENVFVFLHINPVGLSKHAVKTDGFTALLNEYKNVKAVFNGHDHDEAEVKMLDGIPFIYDAHFGGNWGTDYRGFRIVELHKDGSLLTYMMNPLERINEVRI
jgi:3',5'-cyclic AMP phosphodiesterase CpdA